MNQDILLNKLLPTLIEWDSGRVYFPLEKMPANKMHTVEKTFDGVRVALRHFSPQRLGAPAAYGVHFPDAAQARTVLGLPDWATDTVTVLPNVRLRDYVRGSLTDKKRAKNHLVNHILDADLSVSFDGTNTYVDGIKVYDDNSVVLVATSSPIRVFVTQTGEDVIIFNHHGGVLVEQVNDKSLLNQWVEAVHYQQQFGGDVDIWHYYVTSDDLKIVDGKVVVDGYEEFELRPSNDDTPLVFWNDRYAFAYDDDVELKESCALHLEIVQ